MSNENLRVDSTANARPAQGVVSEIMRNEKGVLAIAFALTFCAIIAALPYLPRYYKATATVVMNLADHDVLSDANQLPKGPVDTAAIQTQVQVIKSRALLEQVVAKLHLIDDPEYNPSLLGKRLWWQELAYAGTDRKDPLYDVVSNLERRLDVDQTPKAYTVEVTISSRDPEKASLVANTIAGTYLDYKMRARRDTVSRLADGLGQRTETLEEKARQSRVALQRFISENRLVEPAWGASAEKELGTLSEELAKTIIVSSEAVSRARALNDMAQMGMADGSPEVLNSRIIQMLKERALKLNQSNRIGITENEMIEIGREMDVEVHRIIRAAQTEAAVAQGKEARIRAEINRLRANMAERARLEVRLAELRKESEADDAVLRDAAVRFKTQTNALELLEPDVKIVSPAVAPTRPSFPQVPLYVAGAVVSSLMAAVAGALWSHAVKLNRGRRRAAHRLA